MQGKEIERSIQQLEERYLQKGLTLKSEVVQQLELLISNRGERKGSVLHSIDRTRTASGGRLLKNWLLFPLTNLDEINDRQEQIQFWMDRPGPLKEVRTHLSRMGDPERRLGKISNPSCNSRDLLSLLESLRCGLELVPFCTPRAQDCETLPSVRSLVQKIEDQLLEELPVSVRQGGMFRKGRWPELDELIELSENSQDLLQQLESRERESSGISSLKVRFNNVFGYYIEVTKVHTEKVPTRYVRKQTLANAERYTIPELQELEGKILSAESRRSQLEFELFQKLRLEILSGAAYLQYWTRQWSALDVYTSLAWLALERNYCRPKLITRGALHIEAGRHPVVEQLMVGTFVANSIDLQPSQCLLLTGPNMAGKSTLMRQTAVIVILAQMGGFVPAEAAQVPVFDRVFTRIGASDSLGEGLSTFMMEMQEAAEIVRAATDRSLVLLDEIGRGTSTYDGMSLAQALLEHLLTVSKSVVLFATHYHELTSLSTRYPQIINMHMAIREEKGEISFLHSLRAGPANRSYGIHVAKLAGVPGAITRRAQQLLERHEAGVSGGTEQLNLIEQTPAEPQLPRELEALINEMRAAPVQKMTPLEALNTIAQWQRHLT